ncbi:MAG: caspase family protein [Bacteroidales bacterium]|nr:caspase family protein [Bacteroidales bacterium]
MKKVHIIKLVFATLAVTLALSSCSIYNESLVSTTNPPIKQKLPCMQVTFKKSNNSFLGASADIDFEIVEKTITEELKHNIISYGAPSNSNGRIEAVCERLDEANNQTWLMLSACTLFTANFLGFPIDVTKWDIKMQFNIYDNNNEIIKKYKYRATDKSLLGFYYGRGNGVVLVDVTKKVLADFRKDIERDADMITQKINESAVPKYPNNNYYQQPAIAQQQIQPVQQQVVNQPAQTVTEKSIQSDVDVNIPKTGRKASDTFVLIIANEHYAFVDNVDFAVHDGEIFKEYCINTLGVPERQVWFYKDASAGIISGGVDKMVQAMSLFDNSKAIVYYCGHGIPDEHTGDAYIVPTDGKGTNTATCYSLNKLYTTLAASNATSITYFMDACFSGANKEGSMLVAARGVAREAKKETLKGNTVVFSAASGAETAMTYKEKGHGLFTYYLLKKLQETKGDVSYGDLDKYIKDNVKRESFLTNEKVQTPTTNVSENAVDSWREMNLK